VPRCAGKGTTKTTLSSNVKTGRVEKPIVSMYYFWLVAPYYIQLTQYETSMAHAIANSHKTQF
jgi:hypothetical protein